MLTEFVRSLAVSLRCLLCLILLRLISTGLRLLIKFGPLANLQQIGLTHSVKMLEGEFRVALFLQLYSGVSHRWLARIFS